MAGSEALKEIGSIPGERPYVTADEKQNSMRGKIGIGRSQAAPDLPTSPQGPRPPRPSPGSAPAPVSAGGTPAPAASAAGSGATPEQVGVDPWAARMWQAVAEGPGANDYVQGIASRARPELPNQVAPTWDIGSVAAAAWDLVGKSAQAFTDAAFKTPVGAIALGADRVLNTGLTRATAQQMRDENQPAWEGGKAAYDRLMSAFLGVAASTDDEATRNLALAPAAVGSVLPMAFGGAATIKALRNAPAAVKAGVKRIADVLDSLRAPKVEPRPMQVHRLADDIPPLDLTDEEAAQFDDFTSETHVNEVLSHEHQKVMDQEPWKYTKDEYLKDRSDWHFGPGEDINRAAWDPEIFGAPPARAAGDMRSDSEIEFMNQVFDDVRPHTEPRAGIQVVEPETVGPNPAGQEPEHWGNQGFIAYTDVTGEPIAAAIYDPLGVVYMSADRSRGLAAAKAAIAVGLELEKRGVALPRTAMTKFSAQLYHKLSVARAIEEGKPVSAAVRKDYPNLMRQMSKIKEMGAAGFALAFPQFFMEESYDTGDYREELDRISQQKGASSDLHNLARQAFTE